MTKVFISPSPDNAPYGIGRVIEAMYRHLPEHGIEIVDSEEKADVVNAHATAFVTTNKPIVYSSHGLYWHEDGWPDAWLNANQSMINYMAGAKYITAVSRWVAYALARGSMWRPEVIYHGVDSDVWTPGTVRNNYVLWNKARADPVSDPTAVNKLAQLLPDIPFVSTFGDRANNVQITGAVPHATMRDMVQQAGVYLSTTLETFGIGTLEALACGVPVVGWAIGGNLEIIEQGINGILVPEGDYDALAEAVRQTITNQAMRENARETAVTQWGWELRMKQYASLFHLARIHEKTAKESPRVSVVVTAHNLGRFLPDCLTSVQNQPFRDWECVIVDDVSDDNTPEIAEAFTAEDERFVYYRTPTNLLTAGARNYGFAHALGEYVIPLDADDMLAEDALTPLVDALDKNPWTSIVYGHLDVINEDGTGRRRNDWPFGRFEWLGQVAHLNQLPYSAMMRMKVWEESGGYRARDRWTEDALFWTQVTSLGARANKVTEKPTLLYRLRQASKSRGSEAKNVGWTSWFPWRLAENPQDGYELRKKQMQPPDHIVPFAAQTGKDNGRLSWPVWRHDRPLVSVVIPVGPGHAKYIIDAVDSVQAQTFPFWECIVVDNTRSYEFDGVTLPAWVNLLKNDEAGIASSRNMGWKQAKAPLIVFLDADDILLPDALEVLVNGYVESDGRYTYGDWLAVDPKQIKPESSKDYTQLAWAKSGLHPITCLLPKEWIEAVGGFDPEIPGWEDWDFFIKLAVNGYCGKRVESLTMAYRIHGGQRREQSLADADKTLPILRERYSDYFEGRTKMAGCCGGNGTTIIEAKTRLGLIQRPATRSVAPMGNGMIRIKATSEQVGSRTYNRVSGVELKKPYTLGNNATHRFADAYPEDAALLVEAGYAEYVNKSAPASLHQIQETPTAVPVVAPPPTAPVPEPADIAAIADMNLKDLRKEAAGLTLDQLRELRAAEEAGKNRSTAVSFIDALIEDTERVG